MCHYLPRYAEMLYHTYGDMVIENLRFFAVLPTPINLV